MYVRYVGALCAVECFICVLTELFLVVGLFPVAFAVVNEETDDNWCYFFQHVRSAVGVSMSIVVVSIGIMAS